ncbi:hypothetical protein PI125_g21035 [Phytophthora idaei]|nr:hypothetical protein PI125_g21035 [Phytophthora idaei]KAG3132473.1 hypothetical protein PI126_g19626 [Phytophthora idaei]
MGADSVTRSGDAEEIGSGQSAFVSSSLPLLDSMTMILFGSQTDAAAASPGSNSQ